MKIKCKNCGSIIKSSYRHDLVTCTCKGIFIDGGSEYTRIGWKSGEKEDWVEEIKGREED